MLSIIVPVYNVERYLEECLNSLLRLKMEKEIIVVNDGSKDGSLELLKRYESMKLENFLVINKENEGLSEARNVGMRAARGRYIYFIDSDDFIDPVKFEELYSEGMKNNVEFIKKKSRIFY